MSCVYAFGSNGQGQLGLAHDEDVDTPQRSVLAGESKVSKIACGGNHSVVLMSNGTLAGCGDNRRGELQGTAALQQVPGWTPIEVPAPVVDVACGWDTTVVVDTRGHVWQRGGGRYEFEQRHLPVLDPADGRIAVYGCFQNFVVVQGPQVYGWGSNTKCQLQARKCRSVVEPTLVCDLGSVAVDYVAMGKDFLVVVDKNGRMAHASGRLPAGFQLEQQEARLGLEVRCMWTSIHVWDRRQGTVESFGRGTHAQLFPQDAVAVGVPITNFTAGSEHGILVTASQEEPLHYDVHCWGWGEHGNCGPQRGSQPGLQLVGRYATSPRVFGGCATTWVVLDQY
ncbi:hypothetical protein SEUBUCD646_0A00570 [Saccharomyces eubayanus]|uniref:Alpha tubulin suppressor n=2 Tax=Saccharomyces TaxID=4930 RepID=A0A6C1E1M5_SACPS|nr:alpha tubulin suppressor [Saccharomyces pastorianus]CAI1793571.1 hypothetical protein SEUBUCD650_0A00560 [Saccharomyces eubayanus]CAI1830703.1 hypothetical protein SEUBUCD646_0A00570 [Saccharomyces eubayanus]